MQTGSYFYGNKPMILRIWELDFKLNIDLYNQIPIWVRFPSLPIGYWSIKAFRKFASAIGIPLYTDGFTANAEKYPMPGRNTGQLEECWQLYAIPSNMTLYTWNIRGLNQGHKQKDLKLFLSKHKVDIMVCLQTRVKEKRAAQIINKLAYGWSSVNNYKDDANCRICGDINSVLSSEDRLGSPVTQQEVQGLQNTIDHLQLTPIEGGNKKVYSKIDWAFGNLFWLQHFRHIEAEYLNPSYSNIHPRPFILFNNMMEHPYFENTKKQVWEKLKNVKHQTKMQVLKEKLEIIQGKIQLIKIDQELIDQEKQIIIELEKWRNIEEAALRKKARANWIELGDSNSKYFHA
ncbi:hypothetical protein R3W88_000971 [Solanum pinnatisectum]|uniref:DUF4283 domain-containing protein n=1 Tax=Solanum pinnatisectum TaxID=50273 RepID=A0AAV9MH75_9SOLN|nr:hypothetical protein R3W88_000971 [Solanum pinnatisectum]